MAWHEGLEGTAYNIAQAEADSLRVVAGPGTGKSFAMKRRVARLLEEGADPERILAVTFTRNAARGLLNDLRELDVQGCDRIQAKTLHGFAFSLLQREEVLTYLARTPRPLTTFSSSGVLRFEADPLLRDLMHLGGFGAARECTQRIRAFEAAWARRQSEDPGWPYDATDARFQRELLKWLRFHKAMIIGELIPEALRYLKNNPASPYRHAYDHVLVDEYQDLNRAEQELVDYLADSGYLAVVGDPDQSIYSFRYANPEGIDEYGQRHPATQDEELELCRRCPKRVVSMADNLIRNNHSTHVTTRLQPKPDNPEGCVSIVQWDTIEDEAEGLATYISRLIHNHGYAPGDILALSPRRKIGYALRDALAGADVDVHSFYHEEALEPHEAQQSFALLTLLVNPGDRVALRWWLGLQSPTSNASEYARLWQYCDENDLSPDDCIHQLWTGDIHIPRTTSIKARYRELREALSRLQDLELPELVDRLFPDGEDWARPMREASQVILSSITTSSELLDSLREHVTQPEMPEEGDFVRIMSLHKSKGLTSKVVIVTGCVDGLIPMVDSDVSEQQYERDLAEQRRLFYVATTRCREILVMSSARKFQRSDVFAMGARAGRDGSTIASRFLDELGPRAPEAVRGHAWLNEMVAK